MTRREGIIGVLVAVMAAYRGGIVRAEPTSPELSGTIQTIDIGPVGLTLGMDNISFIEVTYGGSTVKLKPDEIMAALRKP